MTGAHARQVGERPGIPGRTGRGRRIQGQQATIGQADQAGDIVELLIQVRLEPTERTFVGSQLTREFGRARVAGVVWGGRRRGARFKVRRCVGHETA